MVGWSSGSNNHFVKKWFLTFEFWRQLLYAEGEENVCDLPSEERELQVKILFQISQMFQVPRSLIQNYACLAECKQVYHYIVYHTFSQLKRKYMRFLFCLNPAITSINNNPGWLNNFVLMFSQIKILYTRITRRMWRKAPSRIWK